MQGLLLGSFYWVHWVTQIPGGILAKKYGTKIIFGLANVIGCWICFALPIVSYLSFEWLLWLRLFQGLICVSKVVQVKFSVISNHNQYSLDFIYRDWHGQQCIT